MEKAISEIVGRGERDGGGVDVYRALRPLLCSTCVAEIPEGSLFTRRKVKGIGLRIMPVCQKCDPFSLRPSRKERSELLRALLTEQGGEETGRGESKPSPGRGGAKSVKEEVKSRLGPALERGRRGRR